MDHEILGRLTGLCVESSLKYNISSPQGMRLDGTNRFEDGVRSVRKRSSAIRGCWQLIVLLVVLPGLGLSAAERADVKKVVLIAGPKSHGPVGNGIHDYPWSVRLLKVMLDNSNVQEKLRVEYHLEGWPEDPTTLDDADTIMVISDGRDGDKYQEAPHLQDPVKVAWIEKQVKRGCGFMTFHFSTFAPDSQARRILNWEPRVSFSELARLMTEHDLEIARSDCDGVATESSQ